MQRAMNETPAGRQLSRHDMEVVIRRAAELEAQGGSDVPEISEEDVLRIAGEVGLSEENVRRALAEHYADAAGGAFLAERGWASRLCGQGLVKAGRRVPGSTESVLERLESHFKEHESLKLVRRTKWGSLWEPEAGVVASLARSLDLSGRGYELAKRGRAVEVQVLPVGEDESYVTLTADLHGERAGWFWGGIGFGALLAAAAAGAAFVADVALAGLGGLALLGGSVSVARLGYRSAVDKMRLVMDGTLDRLEHSEPLEPPRPSWRNILK